MNPTHFFLLSQRTTNPYYVTDNDATGLTTGTFQTAKSFPTAKQAHEKIKFLVQTYGDREWFIQPLISGL